MVVRAESLGKRFGRVDALQGLSFDVPEGSTFALVGANGAGKTTTIKVLMNILEPTVGTATVLDTDTRALSPREFAQIGYVSEHQDMPTRMTVSAYIDYLRPFYPTWDRALETDILRQFRLPPDRRVGDLSHGMRMKMGLACALPFRPALLVLDEPLSGLDPLVRDEVLERLRQVGDMTILISSHELTEIETMTTHVAFLDRGRLLFQEALSDLVARVRFVRAALHAAPRTPLQFPPEWLDVRVDETALSFIDTQFSEHDLRAKVAAVVGAVGHIVAEPVALRTIYTSLARAVRDDKVSA
jgi:ABC-2 type transport system ATP-binding protein